ncbi:MAG: winged helix-turn-helix transcriptional regulator [Coriobacteriia bacterium]|nr:winged helix-turn-helix transcriptional regulator [Coriobacteriia bacterium]
MPHRTARQHVHHYSRNDRELGRLAKALGHPARVRILSLLLACETCSGGEIFDDLPLAQSTISEHLRILREAGLVGYEARGARGCYWAERGQLAGVAERVETMLADAPSAAGEPCGAGTNETDDAKGR